MGIENYQPHYTMDDLPSEVLSTVCDFLCDIREVDISVVDTQPPGNSRLRYRFSDPFKGLIPLLSANKCFQSIVETWISRNIQFYADSAHFDQVKAAFGTRNCSLVKRLALELDENTVTLAEESWADLLETLVNDLPNLKDFVVWTCAKSGRTVDHAWRPRADGFPGQVSSNEDRVVAVWKFSSFLTLRHPQLARAMVSDESGNDSNVANKIVSRVRLDDGSMRNVLGKTAIDGAEEVHNLERIVFSSGREKVETTSPKLQTTQSVLYDRVLNASMVRRTRWNDVASSLAARFYISEKSSTPMSAHDTLFSQQIYQDYVDKRSFTTKARRDQESWPKWTNDQLVDLCQEYVSRSNLNSDEHLKLFLKDADKAMLQKLEVEGQLRKARVEMNAMSEDYQRLQRKYDRVAAERNNANNALQERSNRIQEDRVARQYAAIARDRLHDWYLRGRTHRW